jgi:integrase
MTLSYFLTRPEAETQTSVYARICYSGYKFKYYIPEKIIPNFWSTRTRQAKQTDKFKEYPEFNQRLKDIASDISNTLLNYKNQNGGQIPNPETFRQLLDRVIKKKEPEKKELKTFFTFFQEIINQSKNGVRLHPKTGKPITPNTLKTYVTTFKHLSEFQSKWNRKIDFDNIDLDFYSDYTEYLTKKLKLSTNTIGKHIQIIKLILNEATERGLNTNLAFKSKRFVTVRENSDSIYLTENEIKEIESLDLAQNKRLETVRDLFLVGCYTGLRYSDYSILKPEQMNDGFIETKQRKTGENIVIPIHPTVKRIIEKYHGELPPSISNQKTNEYLKEFAKKVDTFKTPVSISFTKGGLTVLETFAKWEFITSHTARRSFATNEFLAGTPTLTIMAITGHKTEKSFLRYIKLTPNEHAKLLKLHWEKRNTLRAI